MQYESKREDGTGRGGRGARQHSTRTHNTAPPWYLVTLGRWFWGEMGSSASKTHTLDPPPPPLIPLRLIESFFIVFLPCDGQFGSARPPGGSQLRHRVLRGVQLAVSFPKRLHMLFSPCFVVGNIDLCLFLLVFLRGRNLFVCRLWIRWLHCLTETWPHAWFVFIILSISSLFERKKYM